MAEPLRIGSAELEGFVGQELGTSDWYRITQREIDRFAEATGDFQPIHVDRQAAARGPFGRTVAHGFLTLSLVASLSVQIFEVTDATSLVNYGVNKVRFPAPVPEGARVRLSTRLVSVEDRPAGKLLTLAFGIELEGSERPAATGETLLLVVTGEM